MRCESETPSALSRERAFAIFGQLVRALKEFRRRTQPQRRPTRPISAASRTCGVHFPRQMSDAYAFQELAATISESFRVPSLDGLSRRNTAGP